MRGATTILSGIVMLLGLPLAVMLSSPHAAAADNCPNPGTTPLRSLMETHTVPPYPSVAQMTAEEGTTTVEVTIGKDGTVIKAEAVKSSGSLRLDQTAVDHVKTYWRWDPPKKDCEPMETVTRVNIVWNLRQAPDSVPPGVVEWTPDMADYPPEARARHEQGATLLVVMLSGTGAILDTRMVVGSGFPVLDNKAIELARARKWVAAQMDGKPVATVIQLAVTWTLPEAPSNR